MAVETLRGVRALEDAPWRRSPGLALALFTGTASFWLTTTHPAESLRLRSLGAGGGFSLQQWAALFSSVLGLVVLAAGLFAIVAYAVHWPAIENRKVRKMIDLAWEELREIRLAQDSMAQKLAALREVREDLAR